MCQARHQQITETPLFTKYPSPSPSMTVPSSDKISATIPKNGNVYNRIKTQHSCDTCITRIHLNLAQKDKR